jgi:hypothetical protein
MYIVPENNYMGIGRMLTASELTERQLVMAKHEDTPRIRSAWIVWVGKSSIGLTWSYLRGKRRGRVTLTEKSGDGLLLDRSGKCIFVWEYINLDGTPFKQLEPKP